MKLKRNLNRLETLALSVAVIGMMVGMSLNTPFVAGTAGTSGPLVFIIATIGVGAIAFSFIRLTSKIGHSGSVYGLVYYAAGQKLGFLAGWALLLTYTLFITAALAGFGLFASTLLGGQFIPWSVFSIIAGLATWFITDRDMKLSSRIMLAIEFIAITLVLILSFVILSHTKVTTSPFFIGHTGITGLSQGLVFGVLTFIGFEAASSLGEESKEPGRHVPTAILFTICIGGLFFTLVTYAQTLGYGLNNMKAFSNAQAPLIYLANKYANNNIAMVIDFGAMMSTFAMAIGSAAAASRLLMAISRDGFAPSSLTKINKFGAPRAASNILFGLTFVLLITFIITSQNPTNIYGYTGTIATFTVLVAYALMSWASLRKFFANDVASKRYIFIIPPIISIILLIYVMYANIYPIPPYPFNIFPYIAIFYMAIGGVILRLSIKRNYIINDSISSYSTDTDQEELGIIRSGLD